MSYLPSSYKYNTISILAQKILKLADPIFHRENFHLLKQTFLKNGYPSEVIDRCIRNELDRENSPRRVLENVKFTISLPYDQIPFNRIKHLLREEGIRVVATSAASFKDLFYSKLKDATPKAMKSSVVYKVECDCGEVYVGHTCQLLKERFGQHLKGSVEHSALSAPLRENGCSITMENVKIVCNERVESIRKVKEMVYIHRFGSLNFQTDSEMFAEA